MRDRRIGVDRSTSRWMDTSFDCTVSCFVLVCNAWEG